MFKKKVYAAGVRLFCLAPEDWMPQEKILAPKHYPNSLFFSSDEAKLENLRVFSSPVQAIWSSVCWKQGPVRPWLIEAEARYLTVFCRSAVKDHFAWTNRVPNASIRRVMRYFDWQVCWPNEVRMSMINKENFIQDYAGEIGIERFAQAQEEDDY